MRSGHILRLTAIGGAAFLTCACSGAPGVATPRLKAEPVMAVSTPTPVVTATIPDTNGAPPPNVPRPTAEEPTWVPPPKISKYTYTFPVADCRTDYARELLVVPKSTIWANRGCAFVSPVDGVVHEVRKSDPWNPATDRGTAREGRFVSVIGKDGVRYLGGHLESVADGIRPGTKVKSGQELGRVGNSGDARRTATNLYFAISWKTGHRYWWIRRGMVNPWNYLDAWYNGNRTLSPQAETMALRKKKKVTPPCETRCESRSPQAPPPAKPRPKPRPTKTLDLGPHHQR
ncbi:M23 family metallopeptidase [Sinosporangium siamense]|nr:M23 family metallopeptidase [Sinosporangium siamense]